jgi:hypothetical protein
MADICLCANHKTNGCKLSDKCKRATATPNDEWQSYSDFQPWNEGKECNMFYRDETQEERLDALNEERYEARKERFGS